MATYSAVQQVGVIDGATIPPAKADGRVVGAKSSATLATKDYTARNAAAPALIAADKIYLGRLRQGELMEAVEYLTDTTFGATTVSIGTLTSPAKYSAAQTQTAVNTWTPLTMVATNFAAGPVTADEDIYATVSAGVAAAIVAHWKLRTLGAR